MWCLCNLVIPFLSPKKYRLHSQSQGKNTSKHGCFARTRAVLQGSHFPISICMLMLAHHRMFAYR